MERVKGVKIGREHKKDYLTETQVKAVLESIKCEDVQGLRDFAMAKLMCVSGMRTIEISRCNVADLSTAGGLVVLFIQGKGRQEKAEYVKVPPMTEKAIRTYLKARGDSNPDSPLFSSVSDRCHGRRLTMRSISGIVKRHLRNAGYDSTRLTAHSLRHTAVTLSLKAGKSLEEVKGFARHANIGTTLIYSHHLNYENNSCAEALENAIF